MISRGFIETNRTELLLLQAPSFLLDNSSSIISVRTNETLTLITPRIKPGSPGLLTAVWFVKERSIKILFNSTTPYLELTINSSFQQEQIVCMIENRFGESVYIFQLNFHHRPSFIHSLNKRIEIELNETIVLTVHVLANPSPMIEWFQNKQTIDPQRFDHHSNIHSGIYSLIIRNLTLKDLANYTVIATNSEGEIRSETELVLKSRKRHFIRSSIIPNPFSKVLNLPQHQRGEIQYI